MRGEELLKELMDHPDFDPEARIQNLELDEEETVYQLQQGSDFIEIYDDEGKLIFRDVPPEED